MKNSKVRRIFSYVVDAAMYTVMLMQMLYAITGNNIHEILGISFFVLLVCHMIIKRTWFKNVFRRKSGKFNARRFADLMIILLLLCIVLLALSSMGVSRMLFPNVHFLGSPAFHSTLATISLTFAVIHGSMLMYFRMKNKKKAVAIMLVLCAASLGIGFGLVPYLNRHFRKVEVSSAEAKPVQSLSWKQDKPLVVYFSRVGNTDFEPDIDAVSGASLLRYDGELMGNTEFMAMQLKKMLACETAAIEITDYSYPSSYAETCTVGGKEIRGNERPNIRPVDIAQYKDIILVYPIWWGTIPAPVATFLESNSFDGRNIHLIATQGSSGFVSSTGDIKKLVPNAVVIEGISVYCDDIPSSAELLSEWMIKEGLADK